MMAITDPRLKEEIYNSLNPRRLHQRQQGKLYYLAKAGEFLNQASRHLVSTYQMINYADTSGAQVPDDLLTEGGGLHGAMKDGYFRNSGRPAENSD